MATRKEKANQDLELLYRRYLAALVLFHQDAAESAGLAAIDYQASNILDLEGALTNGELAERIGLSTGATTRLVDRLISAGLAERIPDPADRRRVAVKHTGRLPQQLLDTLGAVQQPISKVLSKMSQDQLEGFKAYLVAATDAYLENRPLSAKP